MITKSKTFATFVRSLMRSFVRSILLAFVSLATISSTNAAELSAQPAAVADTPMAAMERYAADRKLHEQKRVAMGKPISEKLNQELSREPGTGRVTTLNSVVKVDPNLKTIQATNEYFNGNGWYWDPAEPGTGFMFEAQGNSGFVTFFVYSASNGDPVWFAASGQMYKTDEGWRFTGMLRGYTGGQAASSAVYKAPTATDIDVITVNFVDRFATVTLPFTARVMRAQRFNFKNLGVANTSSQGEVGWYWDPAAPGRGVAFEVQDNSMFMAMFHYKADGTPTWNSTVATIGANGTFTGSFDGYRNGMALLDLYYFAASYSGSQGTISGTFSDACNVSISLPSGIPVNMTRFPIGVTSSAQACRSKTGGQVATTQALSGQYNSLAGATYAYGDVTAAQYRTYRQALMLACSSPRTLISSGISFETFIMCRNALSNTALAYGSLSYAMERGGLPRVIGKSTITGPRYYESQVYSPINLTFPVAGAYCSFAMTNAITPIYSAQASGAASITQFNFRGTTDDLIANARGMVALYSVSKSSGEYVSVTPDVTLLGATYPPGQISSYTRPITTSTNAQYDCISTSYKP